MSAITERYRWVDAARGYAILLVVVGHGWTVGAVHREIYAFHMPLFFMMSGMMFRPEPPVFLMRRRLSTFLPPYLAYLLSLGFVFQTYTVVKASGHWAPTTVVVERVIGDLLFGGARLNGALTVMWFLPCLFLVQSLYGFFVGVEPVATMLADGGDDGKLALSWYRSLRALHR